MELAEIPLCVWRKRSQTFVFRGHSIRYWTAGQGEPLLLIHGFPSASWDWHYLWQPLAQRFRVIACDMLGFGDSAKPANHEYSLLEQADLLEALLEHLNVRQPVHLFAHDYGDSVAQELLARHYESRVELASCVFLNGGLFPETHRPVLMQKLLLSPLGWLVGRAFSRDGLVRSFRQIFGPQTRPSESQMDDFWSLVESQRGPRIMHRLIAYIPERRVWRNRWVRAMQRGEVPLRVIDGGVDPISGLHMVERYRELIPDADTVVLPDIGHYPQIEAPGEVLKHYLAFRDQLLLPPRRVAYS
ncbi:alpha/beta fold hydrolase [Pseudomonas fluorescens]|uniref:2-hydroxy-6-oxo-6-(2'-aminophenyl)hexa-2, 4-dienoic acid hydrolase n=1 Tax=Pseudomonas fluorescens TaxID=294 RepID=A0A5E6W1U3_PSEFL|nr:alpha/beta hydrolase [Pseudomonas fluorescens]VVN22606.1 2-hydroxy-6-oxo-6-(2'-aminophenyl)hexa-2, 4-dienoic acid hydrolase [Pseudomonas fluorescens]